MFLTHHKFSRRYCARRAIAVQVGKVRGAFTLVELLMSLVVMSLVTMVLGGLIMAVQTANEYSEGTSNATHQADATIQRLKFIVSQAGVYRIGTAPTVPGLAVVTMNWEGVPCPQVLVVWSGGQQGGMVDQGVQTRLPKINELVIYAIDPNNSHHFVEIFFKNKTAEIDFQSSGFASKIRSLIHLSAAEKTILCDSIRSVSDSGESATTGAVKISLRWTPRDYQIDKKETATDEWLALNWVQGICGSDSGLRQGTIQIELQIQRSKNRVDGPTASTTAIPFFGSMSYRYEHKK